jgi:predicted nucleic-acid-binding Zn-ribbon protein
MKTTKKCPKCNQHGGANGNVVHVPKADDAVEGDYAPAALTHTGRFLGGDRRGHLEAYVCNDCGYVEFYVKDIPIPETHVHKV